MSALRFKLAAFFAALTIAATPGFAAAPTVQTLAKQAIAVDYDTGDVLFEKAADEQMPTSSMSKTISIYLVFEALKSGRLTMDSELPVSEKAWRMQGSKMFVHVGDLVKVGDLIRGVIIQSGNDASIVLAEGLAGTEEAFADALNVKAKELGMVNSHFVDASGMPDPDHYSTARDLSTLAIHLIRDFPEYYGVYSEKEFTYNGIKQGNRNPLLYRNIGADGIKTGHTEAAGYGLMGSGTRNGRRVVIVMNGMKSMQERADEGAKLLDWALRSFENVPLAKAGTSIEDAPVVMGKQASVPLVSKQDIVATTPNMARKDLKVEVVYKGPLKAPIAKGTEIGKLIVTVPEMSSHEYSLYAGADVEKLGLFASTFAKLKFKLGGNSGGSDE